MKLGNIKYWAILAGALSLGFVACNNDDDDVANDLFCPRMVSNYPVVEGNSIKYVWYEIRGAQSYTIELSYDDLFSELILSEQLTSTMYTATNLYYDTDVYARVKAHSPAEGHDSKWYVVVKRTAERDVPQILHEIDPADIGKTTVRVTWDVSDENPADLLTVTEIADEQVGETTEEPIDPVLPELQQIEIPLSDEQFAAGEYTVEGLKESTTYELCLHNTAVPNPNEQPYNKVRVTTSGAPKGSIAVNDGDNLTALLKAGQENGSILEGQVYSISAGITLSLEGFEFTKGFILEAQPGEKPTITLTKDFTPAGTPGVVEFRGIKLVGEAGLISSTAEDTRSYTFEGVVLKDCEVSGFPTCFIYMNVVSGSQKQIRKFEVDNTIFDGVTSPKHLVSMDSDYDAASSLVQIDEIRMSNSTIMRSPALGGISFITDAACNYTYYVEVDHVTIFESCTAKNRVIHMNGSTTGDSKMIVRNLLLSNETSYSDNSGTLGMVYQMCITKAKTKTYENNYRTKGYDEVSKSGGTVNTVMLELTQADLFNAPADGDLTIKAVDSEIYTKQIGDPRWIK